MNKHERFATQVALGIGDILALVVVTLWGFATHGELGTAGPRMLTMFIPLLGAWLLTGPALGVYDPVRAAQPRQLWRPILASILAGPMAAWLRSYMLNGAAIIPIFVLVLILTGTLGMGLWRGAYSLATRKRFSHG